MEKHSSASWEALQHGTARVLIDGFHTPHGQADDLGNRADRQVSDRVFWAIGCSDSYYRETGATYSDASALA